MADAATTAAAAEAHGSGGLPQFDFSLWPGQIVWALAIFAVLYFTLSVMFLPRLRRAISKRASTIAEALADARALRDEAEAQSKAAQAEIEEARQRAHKLAAESKAKAKAAAAKREADAEVALAARLGEADGRIRAARDQAMTHVKAIAEETAQAMVAKLTGQASTELEDAKA